MIAGIGLTIKRNRCDCGKGSPQGLFIFSHRAHREPRKNKLLSLCSEVSVAEKQGIYTP